MGNTNDSIENSIENQEFQSIKATYRSSNKGLPHQNVDIEAITLEQKYLKWLKEMNDYLTFLSNKLKLTSQQINQHFWVPLEKDFVSNQNFCKANKGRAILTFQGGFSNLSKQVINRSFSNNPFSVSQLWKLLLYLAESIVLFRNSLPRFEINSNKIMINAYLTSIRFLTPFTEFEPFVPIKTEAFVSQEKLVRTDRKINASLQIQKKNDDFVVGMLLAECMLLESCSSIYQLRVGGKKYLNEQILSKVIQKVLKISYYPIKLKLIVVGLMQFGQDQRMSLSETIQLLNNHKSRIQRFQTFHLRRTEFINVFGRKLSALQSLIEKVKVQESQQLFRRGLATIGNNQKFKQFTLRQHFIKTPFESKDPFPTNANEHFTNNTHSLNFSMSHIPKKERKGDDSQSLVWSKSEVKSNRQHSAGHSPQSPRLRETAKQQQEEKYERRDHAMQQDVVKSEDFNTESIKRQIVIEDLFEPFKQESNQPDQIKQEVQQIRQKAGPFALKQAQSITLQTSDKRIEYKGLLIQRTYSQTIKNEQANEHIIKKSSQLDAFTSKKKQEDKAKQESLENDILQSKKTQPNKNDLKPKIPLGKKASQRRQESNKPRETLLHPLSLQRLKSNQDSLSEVMEYKSEFFQSPQLEIDQNISPIVYKYEANYKNTDQKDIMKIMQSKVALSQSESPSRKKDFGIESFQSPQTNKERNTENRRFRHADSLINGLTNLISSKKDLSESQKGSQSPKVVPAQTKIAEYMKSFTKFSPELIAQLNIRSNYPQDEKLKLKARQSLNTNHLIMHQSRQLFPLSQYPLNQQQTKL